VARDRYSDDHTIETIGQKEGEFGFSYGGNISLLTEAGGNLYLKTGGGSGDYNAFGGKVLIGVGDSFAHGTSSIELGEEYYDDGVDQYKISNMHIYSDGNIHIGKDSEDNESGSIYLYNGDDAYVRIAGGQCVIHNDETTSANQTLFEVESDHADPAFTIDAEGDVFCGDITSGAITSDSISTTSLSTDGDLTINSGQTLTVNGTLDVNDTLRLDGYDSLPRLIESGEDSSDGYASVRAFSPCDFFTDSDDADISHNNTGGYIKVRSAASDDPLLLFKSLQNEWASGANIAYGWYLDYVWIYLDQSTSSGGPTSHASDYSVEAHLYKRGLAEGVPATLLASKGIKDIDILPAGSIMTFDLSGVSDSDRKINWGDTLVLRVDLYKVDGSSGSLFKGALISGKEALLHP